MGVPSLDGDHRCLVRIIALLEEATSAETSRMIGIVLDTLLVYGRFHFAREERLMAACRFPAFDFHKSEHAGFTRDIADLGDQHRYASDPRVLRHLHGYLTDWLMHHILIQDMAYKPFIVEVAGTGHVQPAWIHRPTERIAGGARG